MNKEAIRKSLLTLAFEMTASMSTAQACVDAMDLESDEHLYEISKYLEKAVKLMEDQDE